MGTFDFSSLSGDTRRARLLPPSGGEGLVLQSLIASEGISQVYRYTLTAVSHDDDIDINALLGKLFVVEFDIGHGLIGSVQTRYFTGYLSQARYAGHPEQHAV